MSLGAQTAARDARAKPLTSMRTAATLWPRRRPTCRQRLPQPCPAHQALHTRKPGHEVEMNTAPEAQSSSCG